MSCQRFDIYFPSKKPEPSAYPRQQRYWLRTRLSDALASWTAFSQHLSNQQANQSFYMLQSAKPQEEDWRLTCLKHWVKRKKKKNPQRSCAVTQRQGRHTAAPTGSFWQFCSVGWPRHHLLWLNGKHNVFFYCGESTEHALWSGPFIPPELSAYDMARINEHYNV